MTSVWNLLSSHEVSSRAICYGKDAKFSFLHPSGKIYILYLVDDKGQACSRSGCISCILTKIWST